MKITCPRAQGENNLFCLKLKDIQQSYKRERKQQIPKAGSSGCSACLETEQMLMAVNHKRSEMYVNILGYYKSTS